MRFAIKHGGSGYAAVQVVLKKGETVKAESDAMVTKSQHVDLGKSVVFVRIVLFPAMFSIASLVSAALRAMPVAMPVVRV